MESVLRSRSLYYVVNSTDEREKEKRQLLDVIAGDDGPKKAQVKLDKLKHEDQVIAIIQATIEPSLLNSIRGKSAEEAWQILKPVHLANVMLTRWQEMQTYRVKNHEAVCDYIIIMRDGMLVLHNQPEGKLIFTEAMIVLTALGQIQTLRLWQSWVADLYEHELANIHKGTYKVESLLFVARAREAVLGAESKQQQQTQGNDRRAFVADTYRKADYVKNIDCYPR